MEAFTKDSLGTRSTRAIRPLPWRMDPCFGVRGGAGATPVSVGCAATTPPSVAFAPSWVTPAPPLEVPCVFWPCESHTESHGESTANDKENSNASYIPKQPKRERGQISIKLDRVVLRRLEQYGRFLESSRDYIINSTLELVFRKDKSFAAWLETEGALGDAEGSSSAAADLSAQDKSRHAAKQPDRNVTPGSHSEA
jgi:hypothetical protein